jgi:hypothetical protein
VGHEAERLGPAAGKDRDDIRDARRPSELGPPRVGLLHAHLEAIQPQLLDHVRARALVRRSADRTVADRPREHLDVRPGVRFREEGLLPRAAGKRESREDNQLAALTHERQRIAKRAVGHNFMRPV